MASGDTLMILTPQSNEPPSANFATTDLDDDLRWVLDFDGAANESAIFPGVVPQNYAGGGFTVVHFLSNEGTTLLVDLDGSFENMAGLLLTSGSFAAVQSANGEAIPGVAKTEFQVSIAFTDAQIDGLAAGDPFRYQLTRDAVTDTNTADTQLYRIEVRET